MTIQGAFSVSGVRVLCSEFVGVTTPQSFKYRESMVIVEAAEHTVRPANLEGFRA